MLFDILYKEGEMTLKKIGILTFHRAHNYGASLQCLALQKFIEDNVKGAEVKIINYANKKIDYDYSLFRLDMTSIYTFIKSFASSLIFMRKNLKKRKIYNRYINYYLECTNLCDNVKDVEKVTSDYNYIIAGSDQIWNPNLTGGIDDIYFLNFKTKAKKIAYAASLGKNKMDDNKMVYKKLLQNFDSISIREIDGCSIVSNILGTNIKNVIDPTMLLEYNDWKKYIKPEKPVDFKYIFVYTPNNIIEYNDVVNYASKTLGLDVINFKKKNIGLNNVRKNLFCSDPNDFLNYLYYSNIVIVTSFHAVVFSIIFRKKFWVLSPEDNSSRVATLLKKLGLENRSIKSLDDFKLKNISEQIDFETVNNKLNCLRIESKKWLLEQLEME